MTLARRLQAVWLLASLALLSPPARADAAHGSSPEDSAKYAEELQGYVPGASALEGRIIAPCCWTQTIDIHGSPQSNDLRREIRQRLRAGETPDAIEASFVARFGPKILAVPPGSPLKTFATVLVLTMAAAGAAGFFMLKRWRTRGVAAAGVPRQVAADAQLDARLDDELRALDD
jgi:cytochrome c-type biogenesis protein CcmH